MQAVYDNAMQLHLFEIAPAATTTTSTSPVITWYLLFNRDRDVLRAELSLPANISSQGCVQDFVERIILEPIDLTRSIPSRNVGNDSVDVPIRRK
jgi:hypothetical protein